MARQSASGFIWPLCRIRTSKYKHIFLPWEFEKTKPTQFTTLKTGIIKVVLVLFFFSNFFINKGIGLWFSWCYSALQYLLWKWNTFLKKTHLHRNNKFFSRHSFAPLYYKPEETCNFQQQNWDKWARVFVLSFFNVKSKWGTTNCTRLELRH